MNGRSLRDRLRLVVITDAEQAAPRRVSDVVAAAVAAGAPAIQLRDKRATARELLETALALRATTAAAGALLFVNDRLDVALAAEADGVHLGPDDIPVASARAHAPSGFLIGASTDEPDRALALVREGADYIGCGAVYATSSKPDAGEVIGLERLDTVARAVSVPVLGIGGIDAEGSARVRETAAAGVAVIGAVMASADPAAAVTALLRPWKPRAG